MPNAAKVTHTLVQSFDDQYPAPNALLADFDPEHPLWWWSNGVDGICLGDSNSGRGVEIRFPNWPALERFLKRLEPGTREAAARAREAGGV